jgi:diketogulonate reductase-like aldo/keto reductase
MRTRPLGKDGPEVPVIGQGTWELERSPRRDVDAALRAGIDAGATLIDTAEMYGDGRVERLVGELLRDLLGPRRDELFLVSKVLPENASRRGTVEACERSLRRLGTDHLDLYLLHWLGPHALAETVEAFHELVERGLVRRWGVSNLDEAQLAEFSALAGGDRLACNQVLHHIQERAIEHAVVPWCTAQGVAVMGYSPFGGGPPHAEFPAPGSPGRAVLDDVARAHGGTARQVALAFLLERGSTCVVPRSARAAHARGNAAAGDLVLNSEELTRLDRAFPRAPWRGGVPVL